MYSIKDHEDIYEIISSSFGLKFKAQLKNTEIFFTHFFKIHDLLKDIQYYSLCINNSKYLNFYDKNGFVLEFINFIDSELEELDNENNELLRTKLSRVDYDKYDMFLNDDRIGYLGVKLPKLRKKLEEYIELQ